MKLSRICLFIFLVIGSHPIQSQEVAPSLFDIMQTATDETSTLAPYIQVENVETLNSDKLDYAPVPYKDGLVFTSTRRLHKQWWRNIFKREFSYLFYAPEESGGTYGKALPLKGNINAVLNEGAATFSADGKMMVFTRNSKKKGDNGYFGLKLFAADNVKNKWVNVRELPLNSDNYSSCHPSLSSDGKRLYFASNRRGGFGGMDIYVSEWSENRWHHPVNLGEKINSKSHELFPSINDLEELYFSSADKKGLGRLDVFVAKKQDDQWSDRQNLGAPINSPFDDFGFSINKNGRSGYLTSNRIGGSGSDDIYSWQLEELPPSALPKVLTKIEAFDLESDAQLAAAQIRLIELKVGIDGQVDLEAPISIKNMEESLLMIIGTELTANKKENGAFWFELLKDKNYLLIAKEGNSYNYQQIVNYKTLAEDGYYAIEVDNGNSIPKDEQLVGPTLPTPSYSVPADGPVILASAIVDNTVLEVTPDVLTSKGGEPVTPIVATTPIAVPTAENPLTTNTATSIKTTKAIQINNIYYGYNEYHLNVAAQKEVDEILEMLLANPAMKITIQSHTDSRGKKAYNQQLSQRRANAVRDYLIRKGIAADRLKANGMGESNLINHCSDQVPCDPETHKMNRRTEFIINEE